MDGKFQELTGRSTLDERQKRLLEIQHSSVGAFSGWEDISKSPENAISNFETLFNLMIAWERPVFVFDIDGTLMEGWLEVGTKKNKTVEEYLVNNSEAFAQFRKLLQQFKLRYQADVVICTWRGRGFADRISRDLFGEWLVDKIISEGWAIIQDHAWAKILSGISENVEELKKHKKSLVDFVTWELGGTFETGKDICLSFNPPDRLSMREFRDLIEVFLKNRWADMNHIYVTNSNSAVDINPHGIDKLAALQSEIPEGIAVYFGDATNDRTAMEHFSRINFAPANADINLKKDVVEQSWWIAGSRSLLWIIGTKDEIYGVNQWLQYMLSLYESLDGAELKKLLQTIRSRVVRDILDIEDGEAFGIQNQLLNQESEIERGPLYDKVFFIAETIEEDPNNWVNIQIESNRFVRLSDEIPEKWFPTIRELRGKESSWVLFSWVAAITIMTHEGARIPLIKRDTWAPTDAGKLTLPAGRGDKIPGRVALEELIEELVMFGIKDGQRVQIVPYVTGEITKQKAKKLGEVAKSKYISSLIKRGENMDTIFGYMDLPVVLSPLGIPEWWKKVTTHIGEKTFTEEWIYPFHDASVNTWEMIRNFVLDLRDCSDLIFGDGDGLWRNVETFSPEEIVNMDSEKLVTSLQNAIKLKAIKTLDIEAFIFNALIH